LEGQVTLLTLKPIKENSLKSHFVFYSFVAMLLVQAGEIFVSYQLRSFANMAETSFVTYEAAQRTDMIQRGAAIVYSAFFVLCAVAIITWMYCGYKNLKDSGRFNNLTPSPRWAIGAWFVPFLNLVKPYSIMKEFWEGTQKLAYVRKKEDFRRVRRLPALESW
jgi:hypothetical protein